MLFITFKTTLEGSTTKERELSFPISKIKKIEHDNNQVYFENFKDGKGLDCIQLTDKSFSELIMHLSQTENYGFLPVELK